MHALIQEFHVLSGVGEDDGDQTAGILSFDDFTYSLELGRTTVIRQAWADGDQIAWAHSEISRTLWSWGGRR